MTIKHYFQVFFIALIVSCGPGASQKESTPRAREESAAQEKPKDKRIILFFGNSITAGYQLAIEQAFPAIIQGWLDSLGYDYQVVNAGLSGETTASGKSRIDWVLRTKPDIFVLELGANDGLRGLPLEETPKNLQAIIDAVKAINPEVKVIIAGMMVPPNLGQDYTQGFADIFPQVAEDNDATLIPFILEKVAGQPELNLPDGIHPTPEGHILVAETIWPYLFPLLEKEENKSES
ncbi:MAG: arylesterase [Bacteroidota bacterium]